MSDFLVLAALLDAVLSMNPAPEHINVHYMVKAISPGAALAIASRIADAVGGEAVHNVEEQWFDVLEQDGRTRRVTVHYEVAS